MANESKINNSIRNMMFGLGGQLLGFVLNFICRTVFINHLDAEYLGINGLFSNILFVLSLAELGVGNAITCSLYKPLVEKNELRIKALMELYANAYRLIACLVAMLGLAIVPFLQDIIKDKPNIPHLTIIYLMFLGNSVISYFFAYKSTIIIADQKQYITTIYSYGFNLLQYLSQIIVLIATKNFLLYLAIQFLCNFLNNYFISKRADKMYPFLKNGKKGYIDKENRKSIYKNILAMMMHKIGDVAVFHTDNILISMYVGVYWVGLYSNYSMIMGIVHKFLERIFSSISASVGHLNAQADCDRSYQVFTTAFFINFWLYGFCTIALWVLFNPFITLWIGSQYVMSDYIVLVIVMNFYVKGLRTTVLTYRDAMGLFWNDRYKPLFEAAINLTVSIILVKEMGIVGVFLGAFISIMATCFWVEPYILYKYGFKKSVLVHFTKYAMYTAITIAAAIITELTCTNFTSNTLASFAGRMVFCLIIPNATFAILLFRTNEFQHIYRIIKGMTTRPWEG